MAKRLTFDEFRTAIEQRTMPLEKLREYVDFDPLSPVPKLIFCVDALIDQPPLTTMWTLQFITCCEP